MAEEVSAVKKAWSLIMGTAEEPTEGALLRGLLLIIMITGICISGYVIYLQSKYEAPHEIKASARPPTADINRLNAMIQNLNAANSARMRSMEVATAATSMARYPFMAEKIPTAGPMDSRVEVVIIPPAVRIKATMLLEGRSVAVLDIEGEPRGKIFKVGDRFADRKGRIARISQEKVTIVYEGKEFTYTP